MRRSLGELTMLAPIAAFVVLFALLPVALLFASAVSAVGGFAGVASLLALPLNERSVTNSLVQGGLSSALAVAFGYPAGVFLGRYRWPGRDLVRSLLLIPFLLPSLIVVLGVEDLFGAGGSFTEFYATDFHDDVVLMGHDGPGHPAIAQGKIKLRPLGVYHGKVGTGLSVEMSVKNGPVTLLSVVEGAEGVGLLAAHAESVAGPVLEIGNTNSRYRFAMGARRFMESWNAQGPAHHCAVGVGHIGGKIEKLGLLLGIPVARVG